MAEVSTATARLVALTGPLQGKSYDLLEGGLSLGRHRESSISLADLAVSRHHCRVVAGGGAQSEEGGWRVEDLESRDGTFLNGRPVRDAALSEGDLLLVGSSTFLFTSSPGEEPPRETASAGLSEAETATRFAMEDSVYLHPHKLRQAIASEGRTARALGALLTLARKVGTAHSPEVLCDVLLQETLAVVPAWSVALLLSQADGTLEVLASHSRTDPEDGETDGDDAFATGSRVPSQTFVRAVLSEGQALAWSRESGELDRAVSIAPGVHAMVGVPLLAGKRALGVLYADSTDPTKNLGEESVHLLAAIAALAAGGLDRALESRRLERENQRLQSAQLGHGLVGESPGMRKVFELLARAAPSDSTVLLLGESGTGKELAARAIHAKSRRAHRPFVAINCATLSETLLESELFGHERGAFTGAVARKEGKLEVAQGGTLFLDEVGELPLGLQARLLRVLQERSFERVGGTRSLDIDIRLVAATNRDLLEAVQKGEFRDDLYYRLNVICAQLPPLRERPGDVELLASHFAAEHGRTVHGKPLTVSPRARAALAAHPWPGNVRELSNALERAAVLGDGETIRVADLPETVLEGAPKSAATTYHEALNATKARLIRQALATAGGNVTQAAGNLGLHPNHLHRLMTSLGLRGEG